jgi:hypothetical protein
MARSGPHIRQLRVRRLAVRRRLGRSAPRARRKVVQCTDGPLPAVRADLCHR